MFTPSVLCNSSGDAAFEGNALVEIAVCNIVAGCSRHRFVFGAAAGQAAATDGDELGTPISNNRLGVEAVACNLQPERVSSDVIIPNMRCSAQVN